jgi:branched-chain amino acid transport system substrate-binding protein
MVFRSFITSDVESKAIAIFLKENNYKNVAIYYVDDDYGKGAEKVFRTDFEDPQNGRNIVFSEGYPIGQFDHKTVAAKIKSKSPDIVFVVGYAKDFSLAIKQLREIKIDSDIITTAPLSIPENMGLAGDVENILLTVSKFDTQETKELSLKFDQAFKNKYNKPSNYQSASTYLCVKLIAQAIKTNGYSKNGIKIGLMNIRDFPSPLGNITIDQNREGSFQVVVKQFREGKISNPIFKK